MAKHLGREVELAIDIRTAQTDEPGVPVDCDMCHRELLVAQLHEQPVVCAACWALLEQRDQAESNGFSLGI